MVLWIARLAWEDGKDKVHTRSNVFLGECNMVALSFVTVTEFESKVTLHPSSVRDDIPARETLRSLSLNM